MNGNRSVALTLLVCGAQVNLQDKDGKTALMVAIINGHQELVELLLQKNADITVKNLVGFYKVSAYYQIYLNFCWSLLLQAFLLLIKMF